LQRHWRRVYLWGVAALLAALVLAATAPSADLRIAVWPQGREGAAAKRVATLRCGPASGTYESPAAECKRLLAFTTNPFLPVPPATICSQIVHGPEEALVTGTFRGHRVWARFNRRDSCQNDRWNRIAFLFVPSA